MIGCYTKAYELNPNFSTNICNELYLGLVRNDTLEWDLQLKIVWEKSNSEEYPKVLIECFPEDIPLLLLLSNVLSEFKQSSDEKPNLLSPTEVISLLGKHGFIDNLELLAA